MGERSWQMMKRQLGNDHSDTLTSMARLAKYFRLGDRKKATEMGERCWEMTKTKLGDDH